MRNWILTAVMGTQETSTGIWLRSAWSKVVRALSSSNLKGQTEEVPDAFSSILQLSFAHLKAVNLNGDFRSVVAGTQSPVLTADSSLQEETR